MAWVEHIIVAWSRTGCQHSGMATPSSLLISSSLVRRMCRASLMSNVVLFFAWSNTLVSSHSIGCCCPQACSAMADFSVSPRLVTALCSFMRISLRLLYIYMAATARDLVHNSRLLLQRVLVLYSCQLSAEGGFRSEDCSDVVSSAYLSHIFA